MKAIREESLRIGRPIPDDHYGATFLYRIGQSIDESISTSINASTNRSNSRSGLTDQAPNRLERIRAIGDASKVLSLLREFQSGGVTKFIAIPIARDAKEVMEQTRLLNREVLPNLRNISDAH